MAYTRTSDWNDGYNGQVTVTAGTAPITSWSVTLTFPSGQKISTLWKCSPTYNGDVATVRSTYNGNLAAGASTSFGFMVMKNGNEAAPTLGTCTAS
ncbi:cellulose binding domain-containing protein [Streptomyces achromogenes]|uniref:cellulose binding domain-containing protein n=1 Tax=Streptomyces achromogenes TaxID=67255 RepID=UPI0037D05EC5